jgi:hypothetical protein
VLVQDVPGVAFGTIPQRADGTLLKIIPKSEWECTAGVCCWSAEAGLPGAEEPGFVVPLWALGLPACLPPLLMHSPPPAAPAPLCLPAGIKQKAFQQTAMLAQKGGTVGSKVAKGAGGSNIHLALRDEAGGWAA